MANCNPSPFNEVRALCLFPTFVWKADLRHEVVKEINEVIVKILDELRRSMPHLLPEQSWQSDQELPQAIEFRELVHVINKVTENALDHLSSRLRLVGPTSTPREPRTARTAIPITSLAAFTT